MKTEPIEARKKLSEKCDNMFGRPIIRFDFAEEAIKIAFKEGQSAHKIKQLEWDFYGTYYSAETPVIDYMITQENDFSSNDGVCALWVNGFPSQYDCVDEAKAAAQADFEKRVRECLDIADNSNK